MEELDHLLCEFLHDLYLERDGTCRSYGEAALSGISDMIPAFKGKLVVSGQALRGWRRLVPSVSHPPLTWDLTVCVAVHMASNGHWALGVGTLLAFDCYLRIGELTGLRRRDVADKGDARLGSAYTGVSLRLASTKTGKNQFVEVRNPSVRMLLTQLLARLPHRKSKLLGVSTSTYRKHFKASCAALGLSPDYVPHSLRHGGATHDFLSGLGIEEVLRHGRWASTKSARHYIQAGRALLLTTSVPDAVKTMAKTLVANVLAPFALTQ